MKKILSLIIVFCVVLTNFTVFAFSDVSKDHWANEYIESLSDDGIIKGYEDGSFRPEENVTKAEISALLVRAFELSGEKTFDDINLHWAKEYIEKCGEYFYNPSPSFAPDQKATRSDVAYALSGVLNLSESEKILSFKDFDLVKSEMKGKVSSLIDAGLMKGYEDGTLRPNLPVTRAEISALIVRAIEFKNTQKPTEKPDENDKDGENTDANHIYTLYPLKDIFMVKSVTETTDAETGENLIKLTYALSSDSEKDYSSLILKDNDITFSGLRESITEMRGGDLFIFDTGFLGHISVISTLATLSAEPCRASVPEDFMYGTGAKYEFIAGVVTEYDKKSKNIVLTIENQIGTFEEVTVPLKLDASVYNNRNNSHYFKRESVSYIDIGSFVFIRYTDGVCTDVIIN